MCITNLSDNLDQKSPLAAALEEQFSTSLILPLVGSNAESIRTTNGGEVKRTPTYTLDKVGSFKLHNLSRG